MKGVIACGGLGTRLRPLTFAMPKSMLPVHNLPMIMYPINTLIASGVTDITLVASVDHFTHFVKLLGNGKRFGCNLTYVIQEEAKGIAHALNECKHLYEGEDIAFILGDNLFFDNFKESVSTFTSGAIIHTIKVSDPERFGVAELDENNKVISLEEKPEQPKSNDAITGFYIFDKTVFEKISGLEPSDRGEYEITDVLKLYQEQGSVKACRLEHVWADTGTISSLNHAATTVSDYLRENNITYLCEKSRLVRPSSVR